MIFSFILVLSAMQTVLQLSKIVIQKDTFIGQLIHEVEVLQFQAVKRSVYGWNLNGHIQKIWLKV